MNRWCEDLGQLLEDVESGESIGISGFHFVRAPMAQLRHLVASGRRDLSYVAWGGGLPLEFLLSADVVSELTFCFSSFDIFGLAPRFRAALEQEQLRVTEMSALGFITALRAGAEQVPYGVFQAPVASDLLPGFASKVRGPAADDSVPVAAVQARRVDNFLLHAQRGDESGNVEISGARGIDLPALYGAKRVLVTVEERVPDGELGSGRGTYVVPRTFVTALLELPGGSWPTSCLPYYPADYRKLQQLAAIPAAQPIRESDLSEDSSQRLEAVRAIGRLQPARVISALQQHAATPAEEATVVDQAYTVDELMVAYIAHSVEERSVCSVGSVSPLATIAYLLAKRMWAPGATIISSNGSYLDVAGRPMSTITAELLDFHSAVDHIGSEDSYHWYYQRGLITHEVVSAAQVDRRARTNTAWINRSDGRRLRLPGQGGMADVADMHETFFIYLPRHSPRSMVEEVDFVSAARAFHGDERSRYGYRKGRTLVLTNLGVFHYDLATEALELTHVHPGVDVEEVQEQTEFRVPVSSDLQVTPPPTPAELDIIRRELDPLGVRRLEFVPSSERGVLIEELLTLEEEALCKEGWVPPTLKEEPS